MLKICPQCELTFSAPPSGKLCCSYKCARTYSPSGGLTHGESRSRLYGIWSGMKTRCSKSSNTASEYYSDRGISVCAEWLENYECFRKWAMSNGYRNDLTLDRIDNNKGYSPNNCRWATRHQQMQNTRKRRDAKTSKYKGVSKHSQNRSWIAQGHKEGKPVLIGCFRTEEEAARAYDKWALEHYREFAVFNFPEQLELQGGVPR